jgi:rSAM/selenodomain-associated transferase 2
MALVATSVPAHAVSPTASPPTSASDLSIIVPVLNEAAGIRHALAALQELRGDGAEIVVVDGGSTDGTTAQAAPLADRVLTSPRGRGRQMNAGAAAARGSLLLFLHADTRLPASGLAPMFAALGAGAAWGRFDVRIAGSLRGLAMVAWLMNLRSRLTGIATGDQGIFVTRATFLRAGRFPETPLMEDIAFCRRLRAIAAPACLAARVTTSGRRWQTHGLWRTIAKMWWLRLRFHFGADPAELARAYGYAPDE